MAPPTTASRDVAKRGEGAPPWGILGLCGLKTDGFRSLGAEDLMRLMLGPVNDNTIDHRVFTEEEVCAYKGHLILLYARDQPGGWCRN